MRTIDLRNLRKAREMTQPGRPRAARYAIGLAAALALALAGGSALAQGPQRAKQLSLTACYYSKGYTGRVASGARYDPQKLTAAHRTLPFGTKLRVTSLKSRRSVTVVINDRGPVHQAVPARPFLGRRQGPAHDRQRPRAGDGGGGIAVTPPAAAAAN